LHLRSLASELSTFIRVQNRRALPMPAYQHLDPFNTFKPLVEDTRELLNSLLVRTAQSLELIEKSHGMYLASTDPSELQAYMHIVLAVSADIPADQLAQQFMANAKIAPSDRLPELVHLQLPGIGLRTLPVPPRQIPFNAGYVYFQLEPQGQHWDHLLKHGGIGMHIARTFHGLKMELWAIR
jgi:type VI secretion system protein ImpJ